MRAVTDAPPEPVYNLTVDAPVGEFFANGVLVHNCDALRYMTMHVDQGRTPYLRTDAPARTIVDDAPAGAWGRPLG